MTKYHDLSSNNHAGVIRVMHEENDGWNGGIWPEIARSNSCYTPTPEGPDSVPLIILGTVKVMENSGALRRPGQTNTRPRTRICLALPCILAPPGASTIFAPHPAHWTTVFGSLGPLELINRVPFREGEQW